MSRDIHSKDFGQMDLPNFEIEAPTDASSRDISHQIESMLSVTRSLEANLAKERSYSRQLREYAEKVAAQLQKFERAEAAMREQYQDAKRTEMAATKRMNDFMGEFSRTRDELEQYRRAWANVLQREKEAKAALAESETSRRVRQELEESVSAANEKISIERTKREQAERYTQEMKSEIDNLSFRLQTSESRFNDLSKELQALHNLRKNHQLDMAQQEQALRQEFESERISLREQNRAELDSERRRAHDQITELKKERDRTAAQMETQYSNELSRLKSEFSRCTSMETGKVEDKYSKIIDQKDEMVRTLSQSLKTIELDFTRLNEEFNQFRKASEAEIDNLRGQLLTSSMAEDSEAMKLQDQTNQLKKAYEAETAILKQQLATIERTKEDEKKKALRQCLQEMGNRENAVQSLKNESQTLRELLILESKRFHELVDQVLIEVKENQIDDLFDPMFLMYLREIQLSEPVHARVQPAVATPAAVKSSQESVETKPAKTEHAGKTLGGIPIPPRPSSLDC